MGKFNNIKQTPLVKPIGSDAFGRITVAQPQTLFDSKLLHDKMPLFWDEQITNTSGNATSTHSTTNASVAMHVDTDDVIIRQTKTHWNYQPGKAQECYYTAQLVAAGGGLLNLTLYLGSQIDGTADEFVLAVRPFSGAAAVQAALTYQEL